MRLATTEDIVHVDGLSQGTRRLAILNRNGQPLLANRLLGPVGAAIVGVCRAAPAQNACNVAVLHQM